MTYDRYRHRPKFSFRDREKHLDGTSSWDVYRTTSRDEEFVCTVRGKAKEWYVTFPDLALESGTRKAVVQAVLDTTYERLTEAVSSWMMEPWGQPHPEGVPFDREVAHDIWDILVEECAASENDRDGFVHHLTSRPAGQLSEWCFQGALGPGGMIDFGSRGWLVCCAREDETPYLVLQMTRANARLHELHKAKWG